MPVPAGMLVVTCYGYSHSLDGATIFSKIDSNKFLFHVENEMALILTKFYADTVQYDQYLLSYKM